MRALPVGPRWLKNAMSQAKRSTTRRGVGRRPRGKTRAAKRELRRAFRRRLIPSRIPPSKTEEVLREFRGAALGDARLEARLAKVVRALCADPRKSFPQMIGNDSQLEGAYRFMKNGNVTFENLLEPHLENTLKRVATAGEVIVPHDTTEVDYSNTPEREGLGRLRGNGGRKDQGFLFHCALAVATGGSRQPLGLLGAIPAVRTGPKTSRTKKGRRLSGSEYARRKNKESDRWLQLVDACEMAIGGTAKAIHVMDREADAFPLLLGLSLKQRQFVVRLSRDRRVDSDVDPDHELKLRQALEGAADFLETEVAISKRKGKTAPRHSKLVPARRRRTAKLRYSAMNVSMRRPAYLKTADSLSVNVVYVREIGCPEGDKPVEWILATSEPIGTASAVQRVVELYQTRWVIEEFFKALKTGCALEERQLETYHALLNTLAICIPIAVQMLALRSAAQHNPETPALDVLTPTQIHVLRHFSKRPLDEKRPTVQEALLAVAGLGGHLKRNGPPGWQSIGCGMEKLLAYEAGYLAALAERGRGRDP